MLYSIEKLSKTQEDLSEFFVSNNIEHFKQALTKVRDVFDEIWEYPLGGEDFLPVRKKIELYKKAQSTSKLKQYPEGFCFPITNFCFELFTKYLSEIEPQFKYLDEYLQKGGVLKIVWGDLRDVFFQTAFQLGGWYVDVAYDAIDRNKPKIRCAKFEESDFKEIVSIPQYIAIKNQYHKGTMCLNTIFPQLFPEFSFLFVFDDGSVAFDDNKQLSFLVKKDNYVELKKYISSGEAIYLSEPIRSAIETKLKNSKHPLITKLATPKTIKDSELLKILDDSPKEMAREDLNKTIKALNFLFLKQ